MSHAEDHDDDTRRDFLFYAAGGTGAIIAAAAVRGMINQMAPSADVQAASTMRQDVSAIEPGTQVTVLFQGKPVFIRRRLPEEVEAARSVELSELIDVGAENANLPDDAEATDENRTVPPLEGEDTGEWLVMVGLCTHFGCVPLGDGAGDYNGWFCPCHGSHYDTSGRIRKGPAPRNLAIPSASFVEEEVILLG
ncbi:MAG: ubiquinol-cytochrome c reductase iron-sulfur subunit [Pseudomonadota bacterium]